MILTVKAKLLSSAEQKESLLRTAELFNRACNHISRIAWKEKSFRRAVLHRLCYRIVRIEYGLSSQLAVRAIGKVVESYRAESKRLHIFRKHSSVVYDERILSFKAADTVSILTTDGRMTIHFVNRPGIILDLSIIKGQADLIYKKGSFYLCLCMESTNAAKFEPTGILGVDFGIVNLAITSDGETFSGETVDRIRQRITTIKRTLQKRGTKSSSRARL